MDCFKKLEHRMYLIPDPSVLISEFGLLEQKLLFIDLKIFGQCQLPVPNLQVSKSHNCKWDWLPQNFKSCINVIRSSD